MRKVYGYLFEKTGSSLHFLLHLGPLKFSCTFLQGHTVTSGDLKYVAVQGEIVFSMEGMRSLNRLLHGSKYYAADQSVILKLPSNCLKYTCIFAENAED